MIFIEKKNNAVQQSQIEIFRWSKIKFWKQNASQIDFNIVFFLSINQIAENLVYDHNLLYKETRWDESYFHLTFRLWSSLSSPIRSICYTKKYLIVIIKFHILKQNKITKWLFCTWHSFPSLAFCLPSTLATRGK